MTAIRKPTFWHRMSWAQKAAYLCSSRQARDYSEACSILARQPRRKRATPQDSVAEMERRNLW